MCNKINPEKYYLQDREEALVLTTIFLQLSGVFWEIVSISGIIQQFTWLHQSPIPVMRGPLHGAIQGPYL